MGRKFARWLFLALLISLSSALAAGKSIALVSVEPAQPRFRLTYTKRDDGQVGIRFEIAPSGKVEDLKTYLEGTVKRVPSASQPPGRE